MNSLPIVALIGMAVLVTATVGFGATLVDAPTFSLIGASDNNEVATARGNVTSILWTEEVGLHGEIETDRIDFTVANNSTADTIIFDVCAVIEFNNGSAYFSPPAGQAPACVTTDSIGPNALDTSNYIEFNLPINVTEIVDLSISIQEDTP
jgi:hypothetical protein